MSKPKPKPKPKSHGGEQRRAQKRAKRAQRKKAPHKQLSQSEVNKRYLKSARRFYSQFNDDSPKPDPGGTS